MTKAYTKKKKKKLGLDRSENCKVEDPRISRQSANVGGKVVSPTHRPTLSHTPNQQEIFLLLISVRC